jgi:hypothetical protein
MAMIPRTVPGFIFLSFCKGGRTPKLQKLKSGTV